MSHRKNNDPSADPEVDRYKRPGLGFPLTHLPKGRFPVAVLDWVAPPLLALERRMLDFINQVSDKLGWQAKVYEESIIAKWRAEAEHGQLTDKYFDYVGGCNVLRE